jgi:hypothetical protein
MNLNTISLRALVVGKANKVEPDNKYSFSNLFKTQSNWVFKEMGSRVVVVFWGYLVPNPKENPKP